MKDSGRTYEPTSSSDAPDSPPPSPSPVRRFALAGPSPRLDPTRHAHRQDIADIELAGRVIASHYAEPLVRTCVAETPLLANPNGPGLHDILHAGQSFAVLECGRGLAWGYRVDGHLVGYVDQNKLS